MDIQELIYELTQTKICYRKCNCNNHRTGCNENKFYSIIKSLSHTICVVFKGYINNDGKIIDSPESDIDLPNITIKKLLSYGQSIKSAASTIATS